MGHAWLKSKSLQTINPVDRSWPFHKKQPFAATQKIDSMGSELSFAAKYTDGRFAGQSMPFIEDWLRGNHIRLI